MLGAAGIRGNYVPEALVHDTDLLVQHFLAQDRDVLRQLLTTDLSFLAHDEVTRWLKFEPRRLQQSQDQGVPPPAHPFGAKPGQNELYKHYNFDVARWSTTMPLRLAPEQRAGILTQPSWLIAHSANTENHAIHRGKWIRERLLGGAIPDTPITVEAKLPDEPHETSDSFLYRRVVPSATTKAP